MSVEDRLVRVETKLDTVASEVHDIKEWSKNHEDHDDDRFSIQGKAITEIKVTIAKWSGAVITVILLSSGGGEKAVDLFKTFMGS